jgi:hypothetical protein
LFRGWGILQADEDGHIDDNGRPSDAPAAGYEEDDGNDGYEEEVGNDDYGSYASQPVTFDDLPHMGTLPPIDGADTEPTEPYSSGEGEVRHRLVHGASRAGGA